MTSESDVVKPVLQILAEVPEGKLSTTEMRERVKERITLTDEDLQPLANRSDFRIDQVIRNLKSHKDVPGNPFFEGMLEDVPRGFRITDLGRRALR